MFEIVNDRLVIAGRPIPFVPTEHQGGRIEPTLIVLHDTAGGPPGNSLSWLRNNRKKVSAHIIIERDIDPATGFAKATQLAEFDRRTNHAAPSSWRGRDGVNGFGIGAEIVNPGGLTGTLDRAVSSFGKAWGRADGVREAGSAAHWSKLWLPYTEAQLVFAENMIAALGRAYPSIAEVVGHHDVSPGRKEDPTPLMDWRRMRLALGPRALPMPTAVVAEAQERLNAKGCFVGAVDGNMGPRTRAAIRAFQEQNRLPITGTLDEATLARLQDPRAKGMPTGTRDETTAKDLAAAGSQEVAAAQGVKRGAQVSAVLQIGNVLNDVSQALTNAENAKTLSERAMVLAGWAVTPRGAAILLALIATVAIWKLGHRIEWRRVFAARVGKHL